MWSGCALSSRLRNGSASSGLPPSERRRARLKRAGRKSGEEETARRNQRSAS